MASPIATIAKKQAKRSSPLGDLDDIPILYEDEEEGEMGESNPHVVNDEILHVCVRVHLSAQPEFRVYSNMNLYYREGPPHPRTGALPYVSPDIMVVVPFRPVGEDVTSYTIGRDGPAPRSVTEILSQRSAQQRDLDEKIVIYAKLGVGEYILVDPSGKFLPQRLLLKRLQRNGEYKDEKDSDGGVTSSLGFRLKFAEDGQLEVLDAKSGRPYVRPAEAEERIRHLETDRDSRIRFLENEAAKRIRHLEDELERLKGRLKKQPKQRKRKKGR